MDVFKAHPVRHFLTPSINSPPHTSTSVSFYTSTSVGFYASSSVGFYTSTSVGFYASISVGTIL